MIRWGTSYRHWPTEPKVQELGWRRGHPWHRLLEPVFLQWRVNGDPWTLRIPAGFETDYATTPRCLWWWLPPDGPWMVPAIGHDWLYRHGRMTRWMADALFYDAMVGCGVGLAKRLAIYRGARLFGWCWYRRNRL